MMNDRPTTLFSTRRKTPQWAPLALGVAVGLALVVLGVTLLTHRPSESLKSPPVAPVVRQICSDLTAQRYDDLYGLLSTAEQAIGTRDQFAASQRQLDAQLGTARTCMYSAAVQDARSASLTLTLTRGTSVATSGQVRLTVERNAWRIAVYDSSLVALVSHAA
jgi:hypothetical protein